MVISLAQNFDLETCYFCGVAFAIPTHLKNTLVETHNLFYCPNGHSQFYTGTTEAERLARELSAARQQNQNLRHQAEALQAEAAKLKKRIAGGVCPCCNRTFGNLQRHMATKHKGQFIAPPAEQKRLQ